MEAAVLNVAAGDASECSGCTRWRQRWDALHVDFENLQTELIAKRRIIAALQRELNRQHGAEKFDAEVKELFAYWQETCDHPRAKLGEKRKKVILARLRDGYTVQQIQTAIDGAARHAFEKAGKRYDDIELICRDEVKLESFMERAGAVAADSPPPVVARALEQAYGPAGVVPATGERWLTCPCCWDAAVRISPDLRSVHCTSCDADHKRIGRALERALKEESS